MGVVCGLIAALCMKATPVHAGTIAASPMVMATTTCARGLSCGLIGYWTFDGKDVVNGRVMDATGSAATGTLNNIATSTFFAPGIIGQGFRFDGNDDYVDIDIGRSAQTFTLSFWWKNNFSQGSWPGNTAGCILDLIVFPMRLKQCDFIALVVKVNSRFLQIVVYPQTLPLHSLNPRAVCTIM